MYSTDDPGLPYGRHEPERIYRTWHIEINIDHIRSKYAVYDNLRKTNVAFNKLFR